jgi:SAM-dependent methyltransferase
VAWWTEQVVPRLVDRVLADEQAGTVRRRICSGLAGDIIEIGFGSGLNVAYYPPAVTGVWAVDPSEVGWRLAQERVARSLVPVQRAGLDGQHLDVPSRRFDGALSTWTLCTVPDPAAALREVARVLRPGGELHFAEHGRAPDDDVARWQDRIQPLYGPLAGGCHLTRDIEALLVDAGFELMELERWYQPGRPKPWVAMYAGRARPRVTGEAAS